MEKDKESFPITGGKKSRFLIKGTGLMCVLMLFIVFLSCGKKDALDRIIEEGEITVITRNNAHCYYLYQDEPMGFEFDLAKAFSEYLGVKLKIRISEKWDEMIPTLKSEKAHVIAASFTITPKRKHRVLFSDPYLKIHQHIINPGTGVVDHHFCPNVKSFSSQSILRFDACDFISIFQKSDCFGIIGNLGAFFCC